MDERQVVSLLRDRIDRRGGLRTLAGDWGIKPSVISRTVNGKIKPPPQVLEAMGLRKVVSYRYTKATSA